MLKATLKISGLLLVILLAIGAFVYFKYLKPKPLPVSAEDRAAISLMPLPSYLKLSDGRFLLTPDFGAEIQGPKDSIVQKAIGRFLKQTSKASTLSFKENGVGLSVFYETATLPVQPLETTESYSLSINKKGIVLKAATAYGVLHGLESLSQLLKVENGTCTWPYLELSDSPRFVWRGLMIDVSRHWIPKEVILRNIEAMAAVKLNVLHLHLSDYQGFRVESKVFPKLQEMGSGGNFLSQADVREIVEYAVERGIRIIPEFDMPGHTLSFLVGYPELGSVPGPYQLATTFGVLKPVMDPTREEVYTFIDAFVGEMANLFPDPYFHIGGDEVNFSQWNESPTIQLFMKQNSISDAHGLQAYFNQRIEKILQKHNKKMVGWDEILNPKLSNDIVVQSWRSHKSLFEAVQKGSKAILSTGYYLDHKLPASKHYATDPEVLPGAVTIKPDSILWQQYDLVLQISESPVKTSLVLYGDSSNLRGLFFLMDNATGFEKAERLGDELKFSFKSDYGQINFEAVFSGDSLKGKMSLGFLSFPFKGKKVGANDMRGTIAPKVELIKPLFLEQKRNILGGEAAMWSEVVSAQNIESRIWPRMAAMAEKWWSPQELTKDVKDMYRRLEILSNRLDQSGLRHLQSQKDLIDDLAQGKDTGAVKCLIDVLEESKYYSRIASVTSNLIPLNEVVDAAAPESWTALKFGWTVDEFISDPAHKKNEPEIRKWLIRWQENHAAFVQCADGNPRLTKVVETSRDLQVLSIFALKALDSLTRKGSLNDNEKKAAQTAIKGMVENRAGTVLAVSSSLQKLINTAL
ncbi:MAG: beta-N-acetylhexosaminidase [Mariniphaga sp.]